MIKVKSLLILEFKARDQQLLYESKVCKIMQGGAGIPHFHYYGIERDFHCLVMDLLGIIYLIPISYS